MLNYYMKFIKSFILKLFGQGKSYPKEAPAAVPENKTIRKVEGLKEELKKVQTAYDKHIAMMQTEFDKADIVFKDFYDSEYNQALKKHHTDILPKKEFDAIEKELTSLREAVHEAGAELDKLEEYKKEDVLKILGELQSLKDRYTNAVADQSEEIHDELMNLKQQYMKKVNSLGASYSALVNTDQVLHDTFHDYGFYYDETMLEQYALLTSGKGKEVKPEAYSIDKSIISKELSNFHVNLTPYK
ncbi:hypothetical protein GCM10010954_14450 [Halobacillus andaensis]|uniref:Uncharacterized protein n=1 Tax=Halobacillus andaensis TaxID=1176239 RepID=A0A917EWL8_HALAA|nr:hypothetical protein [Halobacillus andaensis]MBP2004249.1 gas vesicle protein [Halobacillus andaensis]GGF16914.1 hypothetical protein GCM10010954_14450 [Halobacillus andaensis]